MAPMRCLVLWTIMSATSNRQFTYPATRSNASDSDWVSITRVGFFSLDSFRPLRGFESRRSTPSSSRNLAARSRIASNSFRNVNLISASRPSRQTCRSVA